MENNGRKFIGDNINVYENNETKQLNNIFFPDETGMKYDAMLFEKYKKINKNIN